MKEIGQPIIRNGTKVDVNHIHMHSAPLIASCVDYDTSRSDSVVQARSPAVPCSVDYSAVRAAS